MLVGGLLYLIRAAERIFQMILFQMVFSGIIRLILKYLMRVMRKLNNAC